MSVRLLATRLVKNGRYFLRTYYKRDIHTNILEQNKNQTRNRFSASAVRAAGSPASIIQNAVNAGGSKAATLPNSNIFRLGQHARKLFVDNILNRVTSSYSPELRRQAKNKLFYGDSAPFFALIGVSLASGAGVLSKEDELEGVCWEIREAANRLQNIWNRDEVSEELDTSFNIEKLDVGPPIAKGCAAVVYAAAFKNESQKTDNEIPVVDTTRDANLVGSMPAATHLSNTQYPKQQNRVYYPEMMSPIQNMSRFVHNFGGSVDNLNIYHQSSAEVNFAREHTMEHDFDQNSKSTVIKEGVITDQSGISSGMKEMEQLSDSNDSINRYPLALKMMFNYDIQSNALAILRAMYKETVPARQRYMNDASAEWERLIQNQTLTLPPHPNIVCMFGFFCDEVGNFPDGNLLYPIAQPQRINPNGYGRNMSLYLLMKRYDYSLRGLLDTHELSTRTKLLILAQLLEAVAYINRHGIAHRDLKSDNVLIEMNDDKSPPLLVLSDFGCCLADKTHGLRLPYTSFDIDKGGNAALMAPEIINKQPGPFTVLNYEKSDLWACGAIAYEIFGMRNPFYSSSGGLAAAAGEMTFSLRNSDYKADDLPQLSVECPALIQQLIYNILNPNPSKRLSPDIAANVIQLYLWAPSSWLKFGGLPNSPEILQWLLSLTTKLMCDGGATDKLGKSNGILSFNQAGRRTYVEFLLISSFLSRARLRRIRGALNWIQNIV